MLKWAFVHSQFLPINIYIVQSCEWYLLMRLEGYAEYAAVSNINLLLFDYGWKIYVVNQLI